MKPIRIFSSELVRSGEVVQAHGVTPCFIVRAIRNEDDERIEIRTSRPEQLEYVIDKVKRGQQ